MEPFKEAAPGLRRAAADDAATAADSPHPPLKLVQDIDVASHCFVRIMKFKRKNPIVEAFVPILKSATRLIVRLHLSLSLLVNISLSFSPCVYASRSAVLLFAI